MTTISKYAIWILAGAVIILGISQWRSCSDKTAENLSAEKKVIQRQRDSIADSQVKVVALDSVLKIRYHSDTARFRLIIDSLKSTYKISELKYQDIKSQLNQTVNFLSSTISSGSDSVLIAQLNQLKDQLNSANNAVQFMQLNSSQQDSVMTAELSFRDSVIQAKDRTISNLEENYAGMQALLDKANADLETAIKALQKGKRTNLLRTIGEAALVILLIMKK